MPSCSATRRASLVASSEQHGRSGSSAPSSNSFMVTPTTSYPWRTSSAAATELSTPPDIATNTRALDALTKLLPSSPLPDSVGLCRTLPYSGALKAPPHRPRALHDVREELRHAVHLLLRAELSDAQAHG